MRVLHISKYYYPYIGGAETICRQLVLARPSDEVAVVCFNHRPGTVKEKVEGVNVYRAGVVCTLSRQALSLSYRRVLRRAVREFKPDVIHFHWANPFPAAILLSMIPQDVKLVVHWHMDIVGRALLYRLVKPVETALLERADSVIVTSPDYRDSSKPLSPYRSKLHVVPNAVDPSLLDLRPGDETIVSNLRASARGPVIFFVGRHVKYKGLDKLIAAERLVKSPCTVVLAGEGPLTEELKASASSRVVFTGRLSPQMLRCWLHAASIFAFPSVTRNEAFGIALAEGMYCGLPAVTFTIDGSGVNWVSRDGETGIEAPNGNVAALARAIDRLLLDHELSAAYGVNAAARVRALFMPANLVDGVEDVYAKL